MSKYELSFVKPMKANYLSFPRIIVVSGEKLESFIIHCGSKGHNLLFYHSVARQMYLTGCGPEDSSCFINQTGLQSALQMDP